MTKLHRSATVRRRLFAVSAAALAVVGMAACGSSSKSGGGGKTVSIDVGLSSPVKVTPPIKVAYFLNGGGNSFGDAQVSAAKAGAAKNHMSIKIFDGGFQAQQQFNQIQSAVQSGQYNAIVVTPNDSNLICKLTSQTAPSKNIIVSVVDDPLCGRYANTGDALWQPGTLQYTGYYFTSTLLSQWIEAAGKQVTGPQKIGLLSGSPLDALTKLTESSLAAYIKAHPDWQLVSEIHTDYSTAKGYSGAQNMLQAHPDLTMILSIQSDISVGAANAISQAGKTGKVTLVDYGGSKQAVALVKSGEIALTVPISPYDETIKALDDIAAAVDGKKVPRVNQKPFEVVTKANVDSFTPQY